MTARDETDAHVLGYVVGVLDDIESRIRALNPGGILRLRPADFGRPSPVVAVDDESWRRGIEP